MFLRFCLFLLKSCARLIYFFLKLLPVKQKVVLISRKNTVTSIDFSYLEHEIKRRFPNLEVVILNHKMNHWFFYLYRILQQMYHLATSRACFIDTYVIPVSILKHRKELVVVQIWHALGAIKQFGYSITGKQEGSSTALANSMHMHRNYTYITVGSRQSFPAYVSAFQVDERRILPVGMPRVDYLLDIEKQHANRQLLMNCYPELNGKKVILYAPTFRGHQHICPQELISAIDYKRFALVIKQHQHDNTPINTRLGLVIDNHHDVMQLLAIADYVVTDYSAIVFEAALMRKPLFFWVYDIEQYQLNRGLTLDYFGEMPGFISASAIEIFEAIASDNYKPDLIASFSQKYVAIQDGTCTQKIVDILARKI